MPCISTRKEYVSVTEASSGPIGWFHGSCELPGPELRLQKNLFLTFQRKTTIKAQNWEKTLHHWRVSPPSPCPLIGLPSPPPPSIFCKPKPFIFGRGGPSGPSSRTDLWTAHPRPCFGRDLVQAPLPRATSCSPSYVLQPSYVKHPALFLHTHSPLTMSPGGLGEGSEHSDSGSTPAGILTGFPLCQLLPSCRRTSTS